MQNKAVYNVVTGVKHASLYTSLYKRCMRKDRYPGSVTHVVMSFF